MSLTPTRVSERVIHVTPMDNYARHAAELSKLGASEKDLQELRRAAEMIEQAEHEEELTKASEQDLTKLTAPATISNGWKIAPPTKAARRWALAAMQSLAGGKIPTTDLGQGLAIVAGLWALKEWGEGNRVKVTSTVLTAGDLQELIFDLVEEACPSSDSSSLDRLATDFMGLMGIGRIALATAAKKKAYEDLLAEIRSRLQSLGSTPG